MTANGIVNVGATFSAPSGGGGTGSTFTLSVGRSNSGTVPATPVGTDRVLNCGNACSAKFASGTTVTLTATPPTGKQFMNRSGACSGVTPTCSVALTKDTSVQAVFSK